MMKHFQDLQLSILVPLVLEYFLDSDGLACLRDCSFEHHSEGTVADDLLCVISETLLKSNKIKN